MAKRFGVKVEEFGIGYPPKIIGKKIGETIYSLNALPFGAFVRLPEKELNEKSGWQRFWVLMSGIISFWFFTAILFFLVFIIGAPSQVTDQEYVTNAQVQVVGISPDSPAELAGLESGDIIKELKLPGLVKRISRIEQVQDFSKRHAGEEITLSIKRNNQITEISLIPRKDPSEGEGAMGVGLARIGIKKYPWHVALVEACVTTFRFTGLIIVRLVEAVKNIFIGQPSGLQLVGPVGIMDIFVQSGSLGIAHFFQTMALISLHLAIFNALPIPATDGGRVFLLGLEKLRKKSLNEKVEQSINGIFFLLLIGLMIFVTIKDVIRLI